MRMYVRTYVRILPEAPGGAEWYVRAYYRARAAKHHGKYVLTVSLTYVLTYLPRYRTVSLTFAPPRTHRFTHVRTYTLAYRTYRFTLALYGRRVIAFMHSQCGKDRSEAIVNGTMQELRLQRPPEAARTECVRTYGRDGH